MPITDEEAARKEPESPEVPAVQIAPLQPHTDDEYRAALHDPDTPQPVKRAIKQHLYGEPGGRREVRTLYMRTHSVSQNSTIRSEEPKRPASVSARQWKKQRKAIHRNLS